MNHTFIQFHRCRLSGLLVTGTGPTCAAIPCVHFLQSRVSYWLAASQASIQSLYTSTGSDRSGGGGERLRRRGVLRLVPFTSSVKWHQLQEIDTGGKQRKRLLGRYFVHYAEGEQSSPACNNIFNHYGVCQERRKNIAVKWGMQVFQGWGSNIMFAGRKVQFKSTWWRSLFFFFFKTWMA